MKHARRLIVLGLLSFAASAHAEQTVPQWAVQTEGRQIHRADGWQATWPGVNWRARVAAQAVGVTLNDAVNFYSLEVDGKAAQTIAPAAGERTIWQDLPDRKPHLVRLFKMTQSPDNPGLFRGFTLRGGHALELPPKPRRQIEFIGDSWTVAYGNLSTTRDCTDQQIVERSDASQSFAAYLGKLYGAQIQNNGMSGMGMVRNWGGNMPQVDYRSYHPRLLQNLPVSTPGNNADHRYNWQPQLVVIALGINDFGTDVGANEGRSQEQLAADYLKAYHGLIAELKQRYDNPAFLLAATFLWPADRMRPLVSQVVDEERQKGTTVAYVDWQNIELTGCNWHPNLSDHAKMAAQMDTSIRTLGNIWDK
ncbi:SGNH/GDSL hydrolase family protein [Chromobacterium sp. IIBBL 290-4]|uniref:SGNH/GDSL hydrolase family protein n=1 Tax=Chromobacterium sp. IIBBL 290-4 TaxID=2953890 RepID=UPI0020B72220|nr:SGNH/GDSL hydrolase family protein [Chromobacterium sp. IIBBL 290-4]UTH74519.1 GDSL-type esterase/lipase family protein [Chromobacterium sp. IIBBL 290-4]